MKQEGRLQSNCGENAAFPLCCFPSEFHSYLVLFLLRSPCITFHLSAFIPLFSHQEYFQQLFFFRINISFLPPLPHRVICMTFGNVHCHLQADCSAVQNRSFYTGRSLMRGARQSQAHFQAGLPVLTQVPSHAIFFFFNPSPENFLFPCLD